MQAFELDFPERLRAHLALSRRVYEPRPDGQGGRHWQPVGAEDAAPFEAFAESPAFSAKAFFFAEREALFRFEHGRFQALNPPVAPLALFGLHACDLAAVAYQDRFFAQDPHYQARREASLLVGLDCAETCAQGFCTVVASGPEVRAGTADLILVPPAAGKSWLVLAASRAGDHALAGLELVPAAGDWASLRTERAARIAEAQGPSQSLQAGIAALNAAAVPQASWEALGLRCLGCSGCTSVCPTCSCFAPLDLPQDGAMQRERVWDSCLYEGFQKEASGANASATPGTRVRRYWFHKFGEGFRAEFGRYGCVGCGRCDRICPGGIGVHAVLNRIGSP